MKKVTLLCAAGMSTTLLVKKMKDYVAEVNIDMNVIAMSIDAYEDYEGESDVLLMGPQISYRFKELESKYGYEIPVAVIDMLAYGMLDGKKVVHQALDLIKEKGEK